MECKSCLHACLKFSATELIDTLWNVNMIGTLSPDMGHTELIDTLWNVNDIDKYALDFMGE